MAGVAQAYQHLLTIGCLLFCSYFSIQRVVDVVPEACSTAMTEDRHDELAAIDLSMIAVALTPS